MKKVYVWVIFIISIIATLYYGFQKSGFHEDEYYTYYSSNRSMGLYQPDREWQDRQTILDEFSVKKGEGFRYGLVKLVQSWDVHPPVYYWIFHTVCSLTPGVFSKWSGLITNLLAFVIAYWMLAFILRELKTPVVVEVLTLAFWGLNPMTISCNMLIRMYMWLTAAIFAGTLFNIRLIKALKKKRPEFREFILLCVPVAVVSYVGFLIQYFYLYFWVCMGALVFLWLFFGKTDIKKAFIYFGVNALALALSVLTYPSSLRHMLGGYRGSEAAGGFFDMSNTWMRMSFFIGLLNDFVFAGGLTILVLLIFVGTMYRNRARRVTAGKTGGSTTKAGVVTSRPEILAAVIPAIGYFLLTAKTALLVGSASNRYEMPVYGLIILLVIWDVYEIFSGIQSANSRNYAVGTMVAMFLVALMLKGLFVDDHVLFLYKEDPEKIAYASEHGSDVAVVMFNPATPQNVWRLTDELLQYDRVFYMDEENLEPLTEAEVTAADSIVLYAADTEHQMEAFDNLLSSCNKLSDMDMLFIEDMWTSYSVH